MNLLNRRLKEIQSEIKAYTELYNQSTKETDKQIYQGKLECLEEEEKNILKRYDVIIWVTIPIKRYYRKLKPVNNQ